MKTYYRFLTIMCLALWAAALSAQTHWSFDHKQYQYDMTLYFMLQQNDMTPENLSDYEVAAFINGECRGIGSVTMQTGSNGTTLTYGYMRIYSNTTNGETITFKYFNKSTGEENSVTNTSVNFESNAAVGMPSNPMILSLEKVNIPGDVNEDDQIDIDDVYLVIDIALGRPVSGVNPAAADVNDDGVIDIDDVYLIIDKALGR